MDLWLDIRITTPSNAERAELSLFDAWVHRQECLCYLGDRNVGAEIDVLDGVQELDAFAHGALEGFATGYQAGAACALVDDRGGHRFLEVVSTGCAARIDQACTAR